MDKTYDAANHVTTSPKTYESIRQVYMQDELYDLCRAILCQSKVISMTNQFFPYEDKPISYYAYNKYLQRVARDTIGRSITPHTLRHTYASLLMEQGVDIDTISARLGHANSKVTREIYLHVTEKLKEKRNAEMKEVKLII